MKGGAKKWSSLGPKAAPVTEAALVNEEIEATAEILGLQKREKAATSMSTGMHWPSGLASRCAARSRCPRARSRLRAGRASASCRRCRCAAGERRSARAAG